MSDIALFVVKTLNEYTKETHVGVRSTIDLSPLEEWLLVRLFTAQNTVAYNARVNADLIRKLSNKKK